MAGIHVSPKFCYIRSDLLGYHLAFLCCCAVVLSAIKTKWIKSSPMQEFCYVRFHLEGSVDVLRSRFFRLVLVSVLHEFHIVSLDYFRQDMAISLKTEIGDRKLDTHCHQR